MQVLAWKQLQQKVNFIHEFRRRAVKKKNKKNKINANESSLCCMHLNVRMQIKNRLVALFRPRAGGTDMYR